MGGWQGQPLCAHWICVGWICVVWICVGWSCCVDWPWPWLGLIGELTRLIFGIAFDGARIINEFTKNILKNKVGCVLMIFRRVSFKVNPGKIQKEKYLGQIFSFEPTIGKCIEMTSWFLCYIITNYVITRKLNWNTLSKKAKMLLIMTSGHVEPKK